MKIRILKVGELGEYLMQSIAYDHILQNIYVEGELSNFKIHSTGNIYFTLKDEWNKIRCIIFADSYDTIEIFKDIADGDHVVCHGNVSYYKREGYISLVATSIEKMGASKAYEEFLELKAKLEKQGLFDEKYKKKIPSFPKKIGVVTSKTGAVIQDIYHVVKRRYPAVEIILYSAHVQGDIAVDEVSDGIEYLNEAEADVIIVARGGGSYEELSAFNAEKVAMAIFNSEVPIISAVGHETDFTIADFVADVRASTPSVAGEIAVPKLDDIKQHLTQRRQLLQNQIAQTLALKQRRLEHLSQVLFAYSPSKSVEKKEHLLNLKKSLLETSIKEIYYRNKAKLDELSKRLTAKNPHTALELGAAYLFDEQGRRVSSAAKVEKDMRLEVLMHDGKFIVNVVEKI